MRGRVSTAVVAAGCAVVMALGSAAAGASVHRAKGPQRGGILTMQKFTDQAAGWDPTKLRGVTLNTEAGIAFAFYDVLFYEDPTTLKLVPRLGLSFTTADGGTSWTLKLRPNVKFS